MALPLRLRPPRLSPGPHSGCSDVCQSRKGIKGVLTTALCAEHLSAETHPKGSKGLYLACRRLLRKDGRLLAGATLSPGGGIEQAQTTNSPHPVRRKEESSHSPGRKGQDKQGHDTRSRWARRPRMWTTQLRRHRAAEACGAEQQDPGLKTQPCVPPGAGQAALQPQEFCALVSGGRRPSRDAKAGHLLSGKTHSPSERTRPQDDRVWETGLRRKGLPGWHGLPALCPLVPATCTGSVWVRGASPRALCPWPELVTL